MNVLCIFLPFIWQHVFLHKFFLIPSFPCADAHNCRNEIGLHDKDCHKHALLYSETRISYHLLQVMFPTLPCQEEAARHHDPSLEGTKMKN